jgi:Tfp pilus assembly protein PilX
VSSHSPRPHRSRPHRVRQGFAKTRLRGATLVVGLILLGLVSLLGLAGAGAARVEQRLAQNERFRETAGAAASAGIEFALGRIEAAATPADVPAAANDFMPDSQDRFATVTRFAGFEPALPQAEGSLLAGAHFEIVSTGHFEIVSTGYSSRRAVERQRATVMLVIESRDATPLPCGTPAAPRCFRAGELLQTSWQRVPAE